MDAILPVLLFVAIAAAISVGLVVVAEEERKLRRDPLAAGSALLRRVFGGGN